MANMNDLTGKVFGRLVVNKCMGKDRFGSYRWLCKCDCGNEKIVLGYLLTRGGTRSCGCLVKEFNIKNGKLNKINMTLEDKRDRARKQRIESRERNRERRLPYINVYQKNRYRKFRDLINKIKIKKGCFMCGDKRYQCLEFHHKDPKTKLFNVGIGFSKSKEAFETEIKKCAIICANCHRMLHYKKLEKLDAVNFIGENHGKH